MAEIEVNGVRLYYELEGEGEPLVLVHGSWTNASAWSLLVPRLAGAFRVLSYDRRGHSRSERPEGQGSVHEDADDLGSLIESLNLAPAHVVASSYGGIVTLRLAAKREDPFRSISCHEPPLFELLADDPDAGEGRAEQIRTERAIGERIANGDHEGAAKQFVDELAFGPGAWDQLPPEVRATFVENAPTFLDELWDPDQLGADVEALSGLQVPLRVTQGTEGPPEYAMAIDRFADAVPRTKRETVEGAGHAPQLTAPERYPKMLISFARSAQPTG